MGKKIAPQVCDNRHCVMTYRCKWSSSQSMTRLGKWVGNGDGDGDGSLHYLLWDVILMYTTPLVDVVSPADS